ncbi:peptidoglycan-binding domain-containing protein [Nitratireductor soli]|uniref:peptidoglycan-binding domain-containing protein n=1 Tax=Nitratireductor soli TaxID=1670619 RepID=UPI00065DE473|nr:peptidoglycan-binding protein [Nitratireductor soli]
MKNTARRPEPQTTFGSLLRAGLAGTGMAIVRNPLAVGGTTAFLVSFAFVSANALWYQPHFHSGALISTREPVYVDRTPEATVVPSAVRRVPEPAQAAIKPSNDTTGAIPPDRPEAAESGDATVRQVQKVLGDLGLYQGTIDGLQGPQTRTAIGNYRRIVGLEPSETVDDSLLHQLGLKAAAAAAPQDTPTQAVPTLEVPVQAIPVQAIPAPTPRPSLARQAPQVQNEPAAPVRTAALEDEADATVMRIQAGLKAFGNDAIEVDGVLGRDTELAIREFQSLFGLEVTGQPDASFLAKMRDVGLTN